MVIAKVQRSTWQVAEAKAHLSEVISEAARVPQTIERRGVAVAVVLGIDAYRSTAATVDAASTDERMRRFLARSAEISSAGGVTLKTGHRITRPSPFEGR